jgi:hypothetical protein
MPATHTVVTLDGQEHSNLDAETVKEWFLKKKLREDSIAGTKAALQYVRVLNILVECDLPHWSHDFGTAMIQ